MLSVAVWSRLLWDVAVIVVQRDWSRPPCNASADDYGPFDLACDRRAGHGGRHAGSNEIAQGAWE